MFLGHREVLLLTAEFEFYYGIINRFKKTQTKLGLFYFNVSKEMRVRLIYLFVAWV